MRAVDLIKKKRDSGEHSREEIEFLISGYTRGDIPDYQMSAWLMATWIRGMTRSELAALTEVMLHSGEVLNFADFPGKKVDKHSTGGVGDKTSLILAPIVAAGGLTVPMISGRGLGHTGGTLDKLDAIPGYVSQPDIDLFRKVVANVGCAVIGQTADLAPADRRLYAIRHVTATVESVPLITASILSKKLAAGLHSLVLDVKTGNGAFMQALDQSRALAASLVEVANGAGLKTTALITDMNEPLASAAGNAVEVASAVDFLTGKHRNPRLYEVTVALAAELLVAAGLAADRDVSKRRIADASDSGRAAETFGKMVAALGGPTDLVERPEAHLPAAPIVRPVYPERAGIVHAIDTRAIGIAVVELGGGRRRASDAIHHAVGFTALAGIGKRLEHAEPLGLVHARSEDEFARAAEMLRKAYRTATEEPPAKVVVHDRHGPADF